MNIEKQQIFLNSSQLVRKLDCAPQTLALRVKAGVVIADAVDAHGHLLFRLERLEELKAAIASNVPELVA